MPASTREQVLCASSINLVNANAPKIHSHGTRQGHRVSRDLRDCLDQRVSRDLWDRLDLRVSKDLWDRLDLRVSKAPLGLPVLRVRKNHPAPNRIGIRHRNLEASFFVMQTEDY
jgi:hypothetical protein